MNIGAIAGFLTEDVHVCNGLVLEASWDPDLAEDLLEEIRDWLAEFGMDPDEAQPAGEGGIGRVYRIGDKIVKITPDKDDATTSQAVQERCDHPNLIKVHGATIIPGTYTDKIGRKRQFYAIVMDAVEVKPLEGTALGDAADMVGGYLDVSDERPDFDPSEIAQAAIEYQEEGEEPLSEEVKAYIFKLMEIIQSIYEQCGLKYVDVGATNIGFRDGEIVFLDLGLSDF